MNLGLLELSIIILSLLSIAGLSFGLMMLFFLRSIEKSLNAKILDLYDQVDKIKAKLEVMFN
jgi:hypothetical protein